MPFTTLNQMYLFPQGRNITQYQFIDDFSWSHGRHTFNLAATSAVMMSATTTSSIPRRPCTLSPLQTGCKSFADGLAYRFRQSDNLSNNVPIAHWGLGLYAEDQIKVKSNFTLTLALRAERNSNPVCQKNCFANFTGTFSSLASYKSANPLDVPYSQDIKYNQHQAFQGVDAVDFPHGSPSAGLRDKPITSRGSLAAARPSSAEASGCSTTIRP